MKEFETILETLAEKIKILESDNYCKDLQIKYLKEQLEKKEKTNE